MNHNLIQVITGQSPISKTTIRPVCKTHLPVIALALALLTTVHVGATTIDFETLSDGESVTSQYSGFGISFSSATTLTSGVSLNEVEFPPHSGVNVLAADTDTVTLTFSPPVLSIGGFFTYTSTTSLTSLDTGGVTHSAVSASSVNYSSSGGTPNEYLEIADPSGITQLVISAPGGAFVLDDLTFMRGHSVPEGAPGCSGLIGLLAVLMTARWYNRN